MSLELYVEVGWGDLIRTLNAFSYKTQLLLLPLCWWFLYLSFQTRTLSWVIDIYLSSCQDQCLRNVTNGSNNTFRFEQYLFHSSLLFLLYPQLYWRAYKWLRSQNILLYHFHLSVQLSHVNFSFKCLKPVAVLPNTATLVTKGFCLLFRTTEMISLVSLPLALPTGFPCGSSGKESACNVGDLGLIPGLGRSPREEKGYPLQYSGLGEFHVLHSPWGRIESDTTE